MAGPKVYGNPVDSIVDAAAVERLAFMRDNHTPLIPPGRTPWRLGVDAVLGLLTVAGLLIAYSAHGGADTVLTLIDACLIVTAFVFQVVWPKKSRYLGYSRLDRFIVPVILLVTALILARFQFTVDVGSTSSTVRLIAHHLMITVTLVITMVLVAFATESDRNMYDRKVRELKAEIRQTLLTDHDNMPAAMNDMNHEEAVVMIGGAAEYNMARRLKGTLPKGFTVFNDLKIRDADDIDRTQANIDHVVIDDHDCLVMVDTKCWAGDPGITTGGSLTYLAGNRADALATCLWEVSRLGTDQVSALVIAVVGSAADRLPDLPVRLTGYIDDRGELTGTPLPVFICRGGQIADMLGHIRRTAPVARRALPGISRNPKKILAADITLK